jgi:hypothetical protein
VSVNTSVCGVGVSVHGVGVHSMSVRVHGASVHCVSECEWRACMQGERACVCVGVYTCVSTCTHMCDHMYT